MKSQRELFTSFDEVVAHYIGNVRHRASQELRWFALQSTLQDAIQLAGMAQTPSRTRFKHQRRIPDSVLRDWTARLQGRTEEIARATSFMELQAILESEATRVPGIGSLTVYDTACRIGAFLKLAPARVYLHAGTREGARILGFFARKYVDLSELPASFQALAPAEVEDCLCLYRDDLAEIVRRG